MTTKEYIAKAQEEAREELGLNRRGLTTWDEAIQKDERERIDTLIAKIITDYREMVVGKIEDMTKGDKWETEKWENENCFGSTSGWKKFTEYNQALQDLIDKI